MPARHNGRDRKSLIQMSDEHRGKIRSAALLNALAEHAFGQRKMEATQVQAARILLAKVLPDISAVQISGDRDNPVNARMSVSWEAIDPEKKD